MFGAIGATQTLDIMQGMNYMARASSCLQDGRESAAVKPLVVNMSLGSLSLFPNGLGLIERKLDSTVWNAHQLYVISAANSGGLGINALAAAKNVLAVGASTALSP